MRSVYLELLWALVANYAAVCHGFPFVTKYAVTLYEVQCVYVVVPPLFLAPGTNLCCRERIPTLLCTLDA